MFKLMGTALDRQEKATKILLSIRGVGERDNLSSLLNEQLHKARNTPQKKFDPILSAIVQAVTDTPSAPATFEQWRDHFIRLAQMEVRQAEFMSNLLHELFSRRYSDIKRAAVIEAACSPLIIK